MCQFTKKDYINQINELRGKIGIWNISLEMCSKTEFVMGYFWDSGTEKYKVYINNEKGRHKIRLTTADELEALKRLLSMIEFEIKSLPILCPCCNKITWFDDTDIPNNEKYEVLCHNCKAFIIRKK